MPPERHSNDGQLPSGRHHLSRETVRESQRRRLLDAITGAVAEKGYEATTVADVISRAGVSRATFYEFYSDKDECFSAAYDSVIDQLLQGVSSAYLGDAPWPERIRAGLHALLRYLA